MVFVDNGQGRCVFFLHGWGGGLDSFRYAAEKLHIGCRTINVELSLPESGVFGIAEFSKQIIELADRLLIDKFSIVGHSFGGRCAIFLAANYPSRIEKIVLVSSAGIKPKRGVKYYYKVFKYKLYKKLGRDTSNMGSSDYRALSSEKKKTFVKIVNEDLSPLLSKIKCPTLIIFGRKDRDTPPYMARKLNRKIKDSAIVWLNGGHYAYVEEYNAFIEIIKAFCG